MKIGHLLVMLLVLSAPHPAHAGEPTHTEKDVARDIARRGAEYFDEGDWERAREHFRRAFEIVRAPTLALMEARALAKMGRLVEAMDAYVRASNGAVEPTNDAYRKAAAEARDELAALRKKVPTLRIVVPADGPPPEVRIDGAPLFDFSSPVPINPGTHVIEVLRPGAPEAWQSVSVSEGEERTVWIEPPPTLVAGAFEPSDPGSTLRPLMWTAFGVGGAGVVVGLITGAFAAERKQTLDRDCAGAACPPQSESDLLAYDRLRTTSIVGYVAGIAGIASGAVMFATMPKPPADARKVSAYVSPSPSGLVVAGTF